MPDIERQLEEARAFSAGRLRVRPRFAIVSGSGQSELGRLLGLKPAVRCAEIPHFPPPGVVGHSGEIHAGKIGPTPALLFAGRKHFYEEPPPNAIVFAVRLCAKLGVERALLLNSAGGMQPDFAPGDLMLVTDFINLQFRNPLIGPNPAGVGPRFPDLSEPCAPDMRERLLAAAQARKITLHQGVYAAMLGPTYETRAEVAMLRRIGADAVGMSSAPEAIGALHAGLRLATISCITNSHVRPGRPPTHREVLENAALANHNLAQLIRAAFGD